MARNRETKIGIDYFSHDTDMFSDLKIKLLKARHGLVGYAVYIRLLEELYREKGYYLQLNDDVDILFCDENKLEYNVYILILDECLKNNLFNEKLYKKYNILTSLRIQCNYISATERRKELKFIKEYLLVDPQEMLKSKEVDVIIESLNVDIPKQSKAKKSKEEKIKDISDDHKKKISEFTDDEKLQKSIKEFIIYRDDKGSPMTDKAVDLLIGKLDKMAFPDLMIESIENSMLNNWNGVFEIKGKAKGSKKEKNFEERDVKESDIEDLYFDPMKGGR